MPGRGDRRKLSNRERRSRLASLAAVVAVLAGGVTPSYVALAESEPAVPTTTVELAPATTTVSPASTTVSSASTAPASTTTIPPSATTAPTATAPITTVVTPVPTTTSPQPPTATTTSVAESTPAAVQSSSPATLEVVAARAGDPEYLSVKKSVSDATPDRGESFTYTIAVSCTEASCLDAQLVDALPSELASYEVQNVSLTPSSVQRTVTWTEGASTTEQPTVIGTATKVTVDFTGAVTSPDGTGLQSGTTFNVTLTLKVPDNLAPGTHSIVNTAETTATNSADSVSSATITVEVPVQINLTTAKTWTPSQAAFRPGDASVIALGATNASNIGIDTLTIQEPKAAVDGAASLDVSNPFTITDFTGFDAFTLPAGASGVQVDAYVYSTVASEWNWVSGAVAATPALPTGVTPATVGGLRFTYPATTPGSIMSGTAASVELGLTQRATDRTGADLSTAAHTVDNVATADATFVGLPLVTKDARASYRVTPPTVAVDAAKAIVPGRISAGDVAVATISARNFSDIGANELRLSDLGYFTSDITFGGFTSAPAWPTNASSARVEYTPLAGGTVESVPFTGGAVPAAPSGPISGFEIIYTASNGAIEDRAATSATFEIATAEGATGQVTERVTTNTVTAAVLASNGVARTDDASDTLTLVEPGIDITIDKKVLPSTAVRPGEPVISSLTTNLTTTSDYVTATEIVIEDALGTGSDQFWDAFDLAEIASTQVPADTVLTVHVQTSIGTWVPLATWPAVAGPTIVSMTGAEISAALASPTAIGDVIGIRFTFEKPSGFASDTTVTPYVVATARSTLRSGAATTPAPDTDVDYTNVAKATGSGRTETGSGLTDTDDATDTGTIVTDSGAGPGPGVGIAKRWNTPTVPAQTGERRTTALDWRVGRGFESAMITDPTAPATPAGTVFQAFDLRAINPITASTTPFTNGWYLRYDTITSLELYRNGSWTAVTAPAGGWINASGRFVGHTLTTAEVAQTTGVRIGLVENSPARVAAQQAGPAFDPYAPLPGTGVAASSADRTFVLDWQIRDTPRTGDGWVTAQQTYNTGDAGIVANTVDLAATPIAGGPDASASADATIRITDPPPGVTVAKSVRAAEPTQVPYPGEAPAADYPTATYTLTAKNNSVARASYVRVTDPPACTDGAAVTLCASDATAAGAVADPFTASVDWLNPVDSSVNPFERYDLTKLTIGVSRAAEVDLGSSTVWLLRHAGGTYSTTTTTAAAANALDPAELADVVGVSVTFQGSDPATSGGTITSANNLTVAMDLRLRTTIRSSDAVQQLSAGQTVGVTNRTVAQSYDPVLSNGVVAADLADVGITLTGGVINVAPTKSVSPATILEVDRERIVTVTVGANQGDDPTSSLSPAEVWVRDDVASSPDFWDRFDLTGLGAITPPSGADRVTVSAYGPYGAGGAMSWIDDGPTTIAAAALPSVAAADPSLIEGIEYMFARADGGFFSTVLPAAGWSTTAQFTARLRGTFRSTGEPIVFDANVPVDNTVTVQSDRLNGEQSAEKTATARITLAPGTRELSVNKLTNEGNRFASIGGSVPFDLTFRNSGTGFLTIEELRDTLPSTLLYLGDPEPVVTPDVDGLLPADVTVGVDGRDLVFTWPDGARTMLPGETYAIRLWLELQPVATGVQAVNTMTVRTAETLGRCGHVDNGAITNAWQDDPTTCGTTDYVTPATGANLFTVKGVRGSVPGAFVPNNPGAVCAPSLSTTTGSYYRTPCVANSAIGGTDDWTLEVLNAGTVAVSELIVFDQFPVAGDQFLVSGAGRNSAYRPRVVAGSLATSAPAGATYTVEVTTGVGVCVGTWGGLTAHEPCAQNGEIWVPAGSVDWSLVSGVRVTYDFSGAAGGVLASGQSVNVSYSTVNVEATTSDPSGASTVVPAADEFAYNQFGVKYRNVGSSGYDKIAPNAVGVHLMTGPIRVDKLIVGAGVQYAPDTFDVGVTCSIGDTPLDLGAASVQMLDETAGFSGRIDGIPVGATCTVTEQGDLGTFGESGRNGSPTDLVIDIPGGADAEVPEAQIATLTNDYAMSELSVTKRVDTDAAGAEFGPFDFTLSCTTLLDVPVVLPDDSREILFTLAGGETFRTSPGSIPVGSTCTLSEVEAARADLIEITGVGVTDLGGGVATIELGEQPSDVTIANTFGAGELVVAKSVDGDGAELYGAGPFGFSAVCAYFDQSVLDAKFELRAVERRTFGPFPAGTQCVVTETSSGGATTSALDPSSGAVTIADDLAVTVTATNTFHVTSVVVTKFVTGERPSGDLAFSVSLTCTVDRDGVTAPVAIPGGATRDLATPDRLTTRYDDLPTGAACAVTETERGGASTTTTSVGGVATSGATARFVTPQRGAADAIEIHVVNDYASTAGSGGGSQPPAGDNDAGTLPSTGSGALDLVLGAIAVTIGGLSLMVVGRSRRRHEHHGRVAASR